ncbi:MAG: adenosylmethionine decarboxylase [Vicinamibacterales bacterium]
MGVHDQPVLYSVDLETCTAVAGLTAEVISAAFIGALERAGATVVQVLTHSFPGAGLTCVAVLAESHAVLHTWPETGTVNVDIFSCSRSFKSLAAIADIGRSLGASVVSVQEIPRVDGYGHSPQAPRSH